MLKIIGLGILLFILHGCAQINPLTGGEKDTFAPKFVLEKTFPQPGQLNYTGKTIHLHFDEFVVLKNQTTAITITPQPPTTPLISSKNKKVIIQFNEDLEENTTYSIGFNGAIADYNEGNDSIFQYVFSTGSYIDSCSFIGSIKDGFTNLPQKSVLIGLYRQNLTEDFDSIPIKNKPTYIGQSDLNGNFKLQYIKAGIYTAFAFEDLDRNLLYNPKVESIAFLSKKEINLMDAVSDTVLFKLFKPTSKDTLIDSYELNYPGRLKIIFNATPKNLKVHTQQLLVQENTGSKDSVVYWMTEKYKNNDPIIIQFNNQTDTIQPIMKNLPKKVAPLTIENNLKNGKLLPKDTLTLSFSEPIGKFDESGIRLFDKDSSALTYTVQKIDARQFQFLFDKEKAHYLTLDSAATKSILSSSTNDKTSINLVFHSLKYLGNLKLTLKTDSLINGVLQIYTKAEKIIFEASYSDTLQQYNLTELEPGEYYLRFINDIDTNKRFTPGDFHENRQPETVYYHTSPVKVRSNWDFELTWSINL
ncbi:hypothetical protein DNU06_13775 [Putridiphycobacter roseus]|uniref:SbsA Ig-like domain-containing protein n=1 Tax=Putridiphycobacter roseus TaxID=2219161 RepID=A0A2W1MWW5_9FLAO|nr:Ig-like domain-containing protein [Putridiphycobacter roseus]PZE16377.1 hypothetical protein DNU06_13775 [Putridiphycobacter roseus]